MIDNPARAIAATGIAAITLSALIGPFASHPDYSSIRHSLSELAGQAMPNAWIMRSGFVAFGGAVLLASLMRLRSSPAVFGPLAAFGAAMLAAAIWSHLPIPPLVGGSKAEDALHSLAATGMGVAFAMACGARLWTRRQIGPDGLSALGLLVSVAIPLVMFQAPEIAGLVQRIMFLISFVWIFVAMGTAADQEHAR